MEKREFFEQWLNEYREIHTQFASDTIMEKIGGDISITVTAPHGVFPGCFLAEIVKAADVCGLNFYMSTDFSDRPYINLY